MERTANSATFVCGINSAILAAVASACLLLVPTLASAQKGTSLETSWMELVKGARDDKTGAVIRDVKTDHFTGQKQLIITVPKSAMNDPSMEEVLVIGRRPDNKFKLPDFDFEYEWVSDYDNDNYGLLVRFSENQKTPLRLYFNSDAGFLDP